MARVKTEVVEESAGGDSRQKNGGKNIGSATGRKALLVGPILPNLRIHPIFLPPIFLPELPPDQVQRAGMPLYATAVAIRALFPYRLSATH